MGDRKYIILRRGRQIVSLLLHGSRLQSVHVQDEDHAGGILGNIYVARVKNVVKNLNAAFVEIEPGKNCFLDLRDARKPVLLNRNYDGRLLAEDEIIVQVYKEAMKTKPPAVTCKLSLDGKYCVVPAGKAGIAYSAKLPEKIKRRLGEGLENSDFPLGSFSENYGIVIRTNAKELKEDLSPLTREIEELSGRLGDILQNGIHRTCFCAKRQGICGNCGICGQIGVKKSSRMRRIFMRRSVTIWKRIRTSACRPCGCIRMKDCLWPSFMRRKQG